MMNHDIWGLLLSMYVVLLLADLGRSYQRARGYEAKYLVVKKQLTFKHMFIRSQLWSLLSLLVTALVIHMFDFIFGA